MFQLNVSAAASKLSQAAELRHQAVLTCGTFGKFDTTDLAAALLALALVEPADDGLLGEPGADSVIVLTGRIDQVRARQMIERFGLTPEKVQIALDGRSAADVDAYASALMAVSCALMCSSWDWMSASMASRSRQRPSTRKVVLAGFPLWPSACGSQMRPTTVAGIAQIASVAPSEPPSVRVTIRSRQATSCRICRPC